MDETIKIEEIMNRCISKGYEPLANKIVTTLNPIDIISNDISDDILKDIGTWNYCRMIDMIYMYLYTDGLMQFIDKTIEGIKDHYFNSNIISKSAYSESSLNSDLCSTTKVILAINLFYRKDEDV